MSDAALRLNQAQKHASGARKTTEVLIPILLAAIGLPLIGETYLTATSARTDGLNTVQALLAVLLSYTPALCVAAAVICLRPVFAEYEQGRFVSAPASNAFRAAGNWVLAAFVLKLFAAPLAISLLGGAEFRWRFDTFDIGLMAFAAFVSLIGAVLEAAAAALKAENDEIV